MWESCQGEVVTLAWDEKQMYSEVIEVPHSKAEVKKKEMLAIVIFCQKFPEGKTVAIVPMEEGRGTGKDLAAKTWSEIEKAELNDLKFGGLRFDTTSKNSGVVNGAAKLLQTLHIQQQLLYLACRHHVFEICNGAVWVALAKPAQNGASALHHRSVFHQSSLNTHLNTPVFSQKGLNTLFNDRVIFQNSLSNTFNDRLLTNCLPVFE